MVIMANNHGKFLAVTAATSFTFSKFSGKQSVNGIQARSDKFEPLGLRGLADDEQLALAGVITERTAGLGHCMMDSVGAAGVGLCLRTFIGLWISSIQRGQLPKERERVFKYC